ncbi:hypothetical protein AB0I61_31125 [Polymorphospora rubra]|uniref:hypothetical protein n=1 Tax=Polymorphospora rubra TaxID=338584 RepID=UPI0033C38ABF
MVNRPTQEATEAAVAYLLQEAMLLIRHELAPLRDGVPERHRMHRAWLLADLCHNLPAWLDPSCRARIHEGLESEWRTASAPRRAWMRSCWDSIGYDHTWLPDTPGGNPESDRGWRDNLTLNGDPWADT